MVCHPQRLGAGGFVFALIFGMELKGGMIEPSPSPDDGCLSASRGPEHPILRGTSGSAKSAEVPGMKRRARQRMGGARRRRTLHRPGDGRLAQSRLRPIGLPRPPMPTDAERSGRSTSSTTQCGRGGRDRLPVAAPRWQFLCTVADGARGTACTAPGNTDIALSKPRQIRSIVNEFGDRQACTRSDGIWPRYFAITQSRSTTDGDGINSCTRFDLQRQAVGTHYFFSNSARSIGPGALAPRAPLYLMPSAV